MPSKLLLRKNEDMIKIWNEYIKSGKLNRDKMRDIIVESWLFSKKNNVDPYAKRIFQELPRDKMEEDCRKFRDVLKIAKPFMDTIYNTVGEDGMLVRLTNSDGYVMECFGEERVINEKVKHFFYKGKNIKEKFIGTNAIGIALRKQIPVQVLGSEHYRESYHDLTTSAAPIRNEKGNVIAVLSMTGSYELVHPHTLGMVMASALAIEREIKIKNANRNLYRANIHHKAIMKSINEGIITVNPDGVITDANYFVEKFLNIETNGLLNMNIE
ncbi:MAG: hypothetical protein J7L15_06520, partial [Clostridiales bacterium]|nr:hypothetical protein [Clostridiales bacterium]